jgi:hypothetical protein
MQLSSHEPMAAARISMVVELSKLNQKNKMKLAAYFQRRCAWMNISTTTLVALLQRTPVLRVVAAADEFVAISPIGTALKAAAVAAVSLGAIDSMAGATLLATTITPSPSATLPSFNATVGVPITPLGFTITNSINIASWTVTGNIPPGLKLTTVESPSIVLTEPGNLDATTPGTQDSIYGSGTPGNNTTTPVLIGTPTAAGSYTFMMQGFAEANETGGAGIAGFVGTGISAVFPFTVVVAPAATSTPSVSAPTFTTQPISVAVLGGTVALNAVASNSPTYQWYINGSTPVPGATSSTLLLSNGATASGTYTCVATNSVGSATSNPASVSVTATSDLGRLINLSTRAQVGTGANILIQGFAVSGAGSEPLLVRASGPALIPLGVTGALPDPQLQLYSGSTVLATNNGWGGSAAISSEAASVGAFAWNSPTSHDSAVATQLGAGAYTSQVAGQSNDTGVSLAEVYDATPAGTFTASSPHLINLSARVQVGTGGNVLIAGFAIGGSSAVTVLIRASGPALIPLGVTGTLPDPQLQLYSGSTLLAGNFGWGGSPQIASTAASVGAFTWNSSTSNDSALLITLPPGTYTAQVSGQSGDTGDALVEVYEVQ